MKIYATIHRPLSYRGPRIRSHLISAEPTEIVADFKARMKDVVDVDPELMTVIFKGKVVNNNDHLCDGEFTPCVEDRCFIHIRVEDLEMQERVRAIMAKGFESMIIPLDDVIVGD